MWRGETQIWEKKQLFLFATAKFCCHLMCQNLLSLRSAPHHKLKGHLNFKELAWSFLPIFVVFDKKFLWNFVSDNLEFSPSARPRGGSRMFLFVSTLRTSWSVAMLYGKKYPKLLGILSFIEFWSKNKSVTTLFKHGCTVGDTQVLFWGEPLT